MKQAKQAALVLKKIVLASFNAVDYIDPARAKAVSELSEAVAQQLGLNAQQRADIGFASLIHELGMITLGEKVYTQAYTKMSPSTQAAYLHQGKVARSILGNAPQLAVINDAVSKQFEYVNGKGYPDQISVEDIPIESKILAVCREYNRYTSGLHDGEKYNESVALGKVKNFVNIQFDEGVVSALQSVINEQLEADKKQDNVYSASDLKEGMVLAEGVYNNKDILVMPEGQILDAHSIQKLQDIEARFNYKLDIFVV